MIAEKRIEMVDMLGISLKTPENWNQAGDGPPRVKPGTL
jgi:hypothetical protein